MFGSLVDFLIRHNSDRRRVISLAVRVLLTLVLAAKLFELTVGPFQLISLFDYEQMVGFFIGGRVVVCLILFCLVWVLFYEIPDLLLYLVDIWIANKAIRLLEMLVKENTTDVSAEVANNWIFTWLMRKLIYLLNGLDIIDIRDSRVTAGKQFFKFYDYLYDVENEKRVEEEEDFSENIFTIAQLVVVYSVLDVRLHEYSQLATWLVILLVAFYTYLQLGAHWLASTSSHKSHKLLGLMAIIEPTYDPEAHRLKTDNGLEVRI